MAPATWNKACNKASDEGLLTVENRRHSQTSEIDHQKSTRPATNIYQ